MVIAIRIPVRPECNGLCQTRETEATAKLFSTAVSLIAVRRVVMTGEWGDESKLGGVAANDGGNMATEDQRGVKPPTNDKLARLVGRIAATGSRGTTKCAGDAAGVVSAAEPLWPAGGSALF